MNDWKYIAMSFYDGNIRKMLSDMKQSKTIAESMNNFRLSDRLAKDILEVRSIVKGVE